MGELFPSALNFFSKQSARFWKRQGEKKTSDLIT